MLILTDRDILKDIEEFHERIRAARDKLSELPATAVAWKARKAAMNKRRILKADIEHCKRLISIAESALQDPALKDPKSGDIGCHYDKNCDN
jgi:hypothetical protein